MNSGMLFVVSSIGRVAGAEEARVAGGHAAAFGLRVEGDVVGHLAVGPAHLAGQRPPRGRGSCRPASSRRPRIMIFAPLPWSPFFVFSPRMTQVVFIRCRHLRHQFGDVRGRARRSGSRGTARRSARPASGPTSRAGCAAGQPEQDDALLRLLELARHVRRGERVERGHVRGERPRRRPRRGTRGGSARDPANRRSARGMGTLRDECLRAGLRRQ